MFENLGTVETEMEDYRENENKRTGYYREQLVRNARWIENGVANECDPFRFGTFCFFFLFWALAKNVSFFFCPVNNFKGV